MNNWFNTEELKCVLLCGGKGTRFLPASLVKQKSMIEIKNKPIIKHVIDYWSKYTDDFIFVVKYRKEDIINYVSTLPIKASFVEPSELRGIADGIYQVEDMVGEKFIVVLADCVCRGNLEFPDDMQQGIGVWRTKAVEDIKRNFSVVINNSQIQHIEEKPKTVTDDLCGMGFYFFDRRLFKYIEKAKPSQLRNEIEITDVIQDMITKREKFKPVFLDGEYINITYIEDIERAKSIL